RVSAISTSAWTRSASRGISTSLVGGPGVSSGCGAPPAAAYKTTSSNPGTRPRLRTNAAPASVPAQLTGSFEPESPGDDIFGNIAEATVVTECVCPQADERFGDA